MTTEDTTPVPPRPPFHGFSAPSGAEFSADESFRYLLWRSWDVSKPLLGFVMLNPSTADAAKDDPTVKRCSIRAEKLGFGGIAVANVYAFRATDPAELWRAVDPIGPDNDMVLKRFAGFCPSIVTAWGALAKPWRARNVFRTLQTAPGAPKLYHLGKTGSGAPRHPLYVSYAVPLTEWAA